MFKHFVLLLSVTHLFNAQMVNVSEPISTPSTNTSSSDTETKDDKGMLQEQKNDPKFDIESTLNKYRRNGIDVDYPDRWEDERKRYMIDYPDRNQYEDDSYPNYRERIRFNEKVHPARIHGCGHYSRDVSRDEGVIRSGILQGWLGAARPGNRNEDKRLDMSPYYVTTATPKTAPSYRNPGNKQNGEYDQNSSPKSKYSGNYRVKGSASKEYYNFQGGNSMDDRNVGNSWQQQYPAKNNRVVYYEYNLDDRRPDSGYYSQSGDHYPMNYDQCEFEYDENSRKPTKNQMKNRYPTTNIYGGTFIPQSRLSTSFNPEPNERHQPYYSDDTYQSRNVDRGDSSRNSGYEFTSPFPTTTNDRLQYPAVPSPTYMPQLPQGQFVPEGGSERQDRGPFASHRFNFQAGNV